MENESKNLKNLDCPYADKFYNDKPDAQGKIVRYPYVQSWITILSRY